MQVAFDDQIFRLQRTGGISRYVVELAAALNGDPSLGVSARLPVGRSRNRLLLQTGQAAAHRPGGEAWSAVRRRLSPPRPPGPADVLHSTYYLPRYLRRVRERPHVVTVHDMMPEQLPHLFPDGNPHEAKRSYVQQADVVLCDSQATRQALLDLWGTPAAPVFVVPLAAAPVFSTEGPVADGFGERIVFVGSRVGAKDFPLLPAALRAAGAALADVRVHCVGGGPFTRQERQEFHRLGVADRFSQGPAADDELAAIYRGAALVVVTSRAEGFGLPVLEALSCGTPVVASSAPALREVGGSAVHYFTPGDAEHLAEQILAALHASDPDGRARRARLDRAAQFSWRRCAEQTAQAYRIAADRHG